MVNNGLFDRISYKVSVEGYEHTFPSGFRRVPKSSVGTYAWGTNLVKPQILAIGGMLTMHQVQINCCKFQRSPGSQLTIKIP